jgi:prepilin signal peptidase PulO-like enzyme (type II secretory pathway)
LVEFATGLLFSAVFINSIYPGYFLHSIYYILLAIDLAVMATLVIISVYDLKHKIIPDSFVIIFGILSLMTVFISVPSEVLFTWSGVLSYFLSGPIIALPFFLLWLVSRGRWIGLGDAKLALGIGWFLGFTLGISAVIIGFWIGAVVSLVLLFASRLSRSGIVRGLFLSMGLKSLTITSEVPLAPFLILGFLIVYFFRFDVVGLTSLITG